MVGEFSNGMKKFNFSLFYRKKLKFLPTSYSFLPFLTILDHLDEYDVVGARFERGLTESSICSCLLQVSCLNWHIG